MLSKKLELSEIKVNTKTVADPLILSNSSLPKRFQYQMKNEKENYMLLTGNESPLFLIYDYVDF
jgi:hypothetical protein